MKNKLAYTLMTFGIVFIVSAISLLIYNNYENSNAQKSSAAIVDTIRRTVDENKELDLPTDPFDDNMKIQEIDGYGYIGYISLPALNLDLPVMSEVDTARLKISPCRYYGSTKTNNLVIAAHNYRYHFGYLGKMQIGDVVIFTDVESNIYNYVVDSIEELMPTDVDKVKDSGSDLILYTCTYTGTKRITVRCSLVE